MITTVCRVVDVTERSATILFLASPTQLCLAVKTPKARSVCDLRTLSRNPTNEQPLAAYVLSLSMLKLLISIPLTPSIASSASTSPIAAECLNP